MNAASQAAAADTGETRPVQVLSTAGRVGRLRYILYCVLMCLGLGLLSAVAAMFVLSSPIASAVGLLLGWAAMLKLYVTLTVQRCHDFGSSGWLSILGLVPLVNLMFWFIPGTEGANRYGPPTPPNGIGVIAGTIAAALVALFVIGLLVAGAGIPVYRPT